MKPLKIETKKLILNPKSPPPSIQILWCKNHENPSDRKSHTYAPLGVVGLWKDICTMVCVHGTPPLPHLSHRNKSLLEKTIFLASRQKIALTRTEKSAARTQHFSLNPQRFLHSPMPEESCLWSETITEIDTLIQKGHESVKSVKCYVDHRYKKN